MLGQVTAAHTFRPRQFLNLVSEIYFLFFGGRSQYLVKLGGEGAGLTFHPFRQKKYI